MTKSEITHYCQEVIETFWVSIVAYTTNWLADSKSILLFTFSDYENVEKVVNAVVGDLAKIGGFIYIVYKVMKGIEEYRVQKLKRMQEEIVLESSGEALEKMMKEEGMVRKPKKDKSLAKWIVVGGMILIAGIGSILIFI